MIDLLNVSYYYACIPTFTGCALVEARLLQIKIARMHNEKSRGMDAASAERRRRMDRLHVRRETKNLLDWVAESPGIPNRERILQSLNSVLTLLPPADNREEEDEERERLAEKGFRDF